MTFVPFQARGTPLAGQPNPTRTRLAQELRQGSPLFSCQLPACVMGLSGLRFGGGSNDRDFTATESRRVAGMRWLGKTSRLPPAGS